MTSLDPGPVTLPSGAKREIPYNYTSFTDPDIARRYLGKAGWELIEGLRHQRRTGQSARMLFEVLGDMWVIDRNPFIQEDLVANPKRRTALVDALHHRVAQISQRADDSKEVAELIALAKEAVVTFERGLTELKRQQKEIKQALSGITHADNIRFDGLSRVSHVTDATDWRVELPLLVLTPDTEAELPALIKTCISLGLTIIARGGGTGYTGGAIPLDRQTAVINLEKLDKLEPVSLRQLPVSDENAAAEAIETQTIRVGAGVVTKRVAEAAERQGLAFAVDPTSQDASTIGGNIAMNAGGKKAVLWGTTLDNLVSWRMVDARGDWLDVERLDHNLGKIHLQERVRFRVSRTDAISGELKGEPTIIEAPGASMRLQGLGKDVTDKFLGGLPGAQKEGCDGLITCLLYTSPSPRDRQKSRMPSSA